MSGGDWKQLFKGTQENDYELVSYYLRCGIDPNYQHPEYMALPLAECIRYNHYEIAELLLQHGADPSIIEAESRATPLQTAVKRKQTRFVELLSGYVKEIK